MTSTLRVAADAARIGQRLADAAGALHSLADRSANARLSASSTANSESGRPPFGPWLCGERSTNPRLSTSSTSDSDSSRLSSGSWLNARLSSCSACTTGSDGYLTSAAVNTTAKVVRAAVAKGAAASEPLPPQPCQYNALAAASSTPRSSFVSFQSTVVGIQQMTETTKQTDKEAQMIVMHPCLGNDVGIPSPDFSAASSAHEDSATLSGESTGTRPPSSPGPLPLGHRTYSGFLKRLQKLKEQGLILPANRKRRRNAKFDTRSFFSESPSNDQDAVECRAAFQAQPVVAKNSHTASRRPLSWLSWPIRHPHRHFTERITVNPNSSGGRYQHCRRNRSPSLHFSVNGSNPINCDTGYAHDFSEREQCDVGTLPWKANSL